ncbi:MAG: hypothetical protein AAFZ89_16615, partial [Bacteroidota bacterium]
MQSNLNGIRKMLFLVPPKVQLLDISGPIHAFYEAKEYDAPFDLYYASIYQDQGDMISCAGLQFSNLIPYNALELSSCDYIFVPGINFELLSDIGFLSDCSDLFKWLREQHSKNVRICSI